MADPDVLTRLGSISSILQPEPDSSAVWLTAREVDVLSLVALGFSYAEVARLHLSPQRVKIYMRVIAGRLGAH
ncbi:LuxR C-terminal-related transcriptional regulator [Nocardioides endophyticus]|uniref:LuxR C-terminal-related transcriptional regulator n=1 Tax=Nocardioides endophyticus TaxID=1353775 RepID=UPI0031EAF803